MALCSGQHGATAHTLRGAARRFHTAQPAPPPAAAAVAPQRRLPAEPAAAHFPPPAAARGQGSAVSACFFPFMTWQGGWQRGSSGGAAATSPRTVPGFHILPLDGPLLTARWAPPNCLLLWPCCSIVQEPTRTITTEFSVAAQGLRVDGPRDGSEEQQQQQQQQGMAAAAAAASSPPRSAEGSGAWDGGLAPAGGPAPMPAAGLDPEAAAALGLVPGELGQSAGKPGLLEVGAGSGREWQDWRAAQLVCACCLDRPCPAACHPSSFVVLMPAPPPPTPPQRPPPHTHTHTHTHTPPPPTTPTPPCLPLWATCGASWVVRQGARPS